MHIYSRDPPSPEGTAYRTAATRLALVVSETGTTDWDGGSGCTLSLRAHLFDSHNVGPF